MLPKIVYVFALILFVFQLLDLSECRRGGGFGSSARRVATRGPTRRTTTYRSPQRATTPRYNIQTQQAYPNYNQPSYNRPSAAQRSTTPRYNIQTQQSYPSYNQPGYNQPHYNQPGYNQPHYNQPGYNQPHYNQPGYNQPGFPSGNNYYSPGAWQQNKDHSVRNSVLAGLGGSALGLYLGYKLGGLTNTNNGPQYIGGGPGGYPQYSVVHHYYHGDKPIPKEATVQSNDIGQCNNVTFCTPNTSPLCMSNGTVYCIAALEITSDCNSTENSTSLRCLNSTITLPCEANSTNCNGTSLNTTNILIPCVTTVDVFGDFTSGKLSVNKLSKRSIEDNSTTTTESSTSTDQSADNVTSTTVSSSSVAPISSTEHQTDISVSSRGFGKKYCVTVIAEPVKAPVIPPNLSNEEFVKLAKSDAMIQEESGQKVSQVLGVLGNLLFF